MNQNEVRMLTEDMTHDNFGGIYSAIENSGKVQTNVLSRTKRRGWIEAFLVANLTMET